MAEEKLVRVKFLGNNGWRAWTGGQEAMIPERVANDFAADGKVEILEAELDEPEPVESTPKVSPFNRESRRFFKK